MKLHQRFCVRIHMLRCLPVLRIRGIRITKICHIHVHRTGNACNRSLVRTLPHRIIPRIFRFLRLRVRCHQILCHPYLKAIFNPTGLPLALRLQLILRRIKHRGISSVINFLHKSNCKVRALRIRKVVLSALCIIKAFAIECNRIGDLVLRNIICCPVCFLYGFLLGHCRGKEINAHLNAIRLRLLHIILCIGVRRDLTRLQCPVTCPYHGKLHSGCRHLTPVNRPLITRYVNSKRSLI